MQLQDWKSNTLVALLREFWFETLGTAITVPSISRRAGIYNSNCANLLQTQVHRQYVTLNKKVNRPKWYTGIGQKNRGHFVLRTITLKILKRSLPNLAQIKVTLLRTSCPNLFKSTLEKWWRHLANDNDTLELQVLNWWSFIYITYISRYITSYIIFLHHFSQLVCIVISLFY